MKLTRKQIEEGLKSIPIETLLLGAPQGKEKRLTASQIKFAEEIAKGKTKAEAYRVSRPNGRKSKAKPATASRRGQELAQDSAIQAQIEAFRVALEAQKYQTPAHLRALTIHKLTEKALSEDVPPAQQIKALELLGKITEVALFTERREVIQTSNPAEMREKFLTSIRLALSTQGAETVEANQADELLAELSGVASDDEPEPDHEQQFIDQDSEQPEAEDPQTPSENKKAATPPTPDPQNLAFADTSPMHSIPHTGSEPESVSEPSLPPVTNPCVTPVTHESVEKSTSSVSSSSNPMLSRGEGS